MRNDMAKKAINFVLLFLIFSPFHGIVLNCFCFVESPSIQYSILRKTISIKMVWGHAHPQNTRPNTTVKRIIKTINVRNPIAKMKKSCGQKTIPKKINLRSRILNINNGAPLIFINGSVKNMTR